MRVFIDQFFVEKFLLRKWLRREKMSKASLSCDWLGVIGWSLLRLGAVGVVHADLLVHYQKTTFLFFVRKKNLKEILDNMRKQRTLRIIVNILKGTVLQKSKFLIRLFYQHQPDKLIIKFYGNPSKICCFKASLILYYNN